MGRADNVLGCPPYKIFSWTCCYAIHSSLAPYPGTSSTSSCNFQDTLDVCIVVSWGGFGGATPKIEDIRKEKWPSQNESRFAFNDPAMDVASNNLAVFSQNIDVMPCRSAEEIS